MDCKLASGNFLVPRASAGLKKPSNRHGCKSRAAAYDLDLVASLLSKVSDAPIVASVAVLAFGAGFGGRFLKQDAAKRSIRELSPESNHWLLTLKPTAFNKFVTARCPSLCFNSCNDSVHQKLNLEDHQVVSVRSEGLQVGEGTDSRMEYQRKFVMAEDGGVLALDWPVSLDLEGDHGLDTTLLLVPGTHKGSQDETLMLFARRALQSGFFPIVMNPRGCAGSPLTTPRIYTAADSDDIRTTVAYISGCRPWTTLMVIGWGYGANMLTNYLAEDATSTPITAAVCVNNPFNLNECTKYIRHSCDGALDKELTEGFIKILKANKMLFQGKQNGLHVTDGLTATSVREFDEAISIPSHEHSSLASFYASASSGHRIDEIKLPLFCIQDSSYTPLFSIPQAAFEENPYTTLLYASTFVPDWSSISNLALEWFAAVELAFLKGRHPLLQGVDLTVKPSKDWIRQQSSAGKALIGDRPFSEAVEEADYIVVEPREDFWVAQENDTVDEEDQTSSSQHVESGEEAGQVQQAAQSVFGALDVVMPGTLTDEVKKQVLDAVGSGETIINALQNAVPEEVRDKLSASVSAAVQARGMSLQLVGFGKNMPPPTVPDVLKESIREKLTAVGILGRKRTSAPQPASNSTNAADANSSSNSDNSNTVVATETISIDPGTINSTAETNTVSNAAETQSSGAAISSDNNSSSVIGEGEKPRENQQNDQSTKVENSAAESEGSSNQNAKSPDHRPGSPPPIDMKQAFEALTGFDDSTQMAVNNVFGVLEELLERMEKEQQAQHKDNGRSRSPSIAEPVPHKTSKAEKVPYQGNGEPMDELKNVHFRLKKTKISGFVLHEKNSGEAPGRSGTVTLKAARTVVLNAMKTEVQKRLGPIQLDDSSELKAELGDVADAVMKEVQHAPKSGDISLSQNILPAEELVDAVAAALRKTSLLHRVIPIGVLVGVILASLAGTFRVIRTREGTAVPEKTSSGTEAEGPTSEHTDESSKGSVLSGRMFGAMTAAMGATAAFASTPFREQEQGDPVSETEGKENALSSIAEKAISVAAPIVPTKDGEVDHDRLVTMLADLGNKAGFLKFLGKAALLWGGLRGAMNVTDRLLVFLRMAERPLYQRLVGFVGMLIIVWSPVVMPLLPSLLNEWASHSTTKVAMYASLMGLYGAFLVLITIWGKTIRGYEHPLHEYGLRLQKFKTFLAGMVAGCVAVTLVYNIFAQLRYIQFSARVVSIHQLKVTVQALVSGVAVSICEGLLFRSWLLEELAADLGLHRAIILSGLAFALLHRLPAAIPGLWFLAIGLAGARIKLHGDLSLSIGIHAGLVVTNVLLNSGGFVTYLPGSSNWVTGFAAGNPLAGVVGATAACGFAVVLYPWNATSGEELLLATRNSS